VKKYIEICTVFKIVKIGFWVLALSALTYIFINATQKSEPITPITKVELGQKLFFEKALSLDSTISCASCHQPDFAFSDTIALSVGVGGKLGLRNAPSVMNMKFRDAFFFDGRATSLSDQVHFPIQDPNEMNLAYSAAVNRIALDPEYVKRFKMLYNQTPNAINIADAIAEFENSLESSQTAFDDYMAGKEDAISESAKRGRELFVGDKAKCFDCHFSPDFTGDEFKNIGLYDGQKWNDPGRFKISNDSSDLGKFKVPGLRNIAITGPYMHDGSFKSLEEVVDYYNNPYQFVKKPINIDSTLTKPLGLSNQDKADLVSFLKTLTDKRFVK